MIPTDHGRAEAGTARGHAESRAFRRPPVRAPLPQGARRDPFACSGDARGRDPSRWVGLARPSAPSADDSRLLVATHARARTSLARAGIARTRRRGARKAGSSDTRVPTAGCRARLVPRRRFAAGGAGCTGRPAGREGPFAVRASFAFKATARAPSRSFAEPTTRTPPGSGACATSPNARRQLGHFGSARRAWLELQHALSTNTQSKYEGWDQRRGARRGAPCAEAGDADHRSPGRHGIGQPADATGIHVSFNGERVSPDDVGRPLDRDPGRYVVAVAGPASGGRQARRQSRAGREQTGRAPRRRAGSRRVGTEPARDPGANRGMDRRGRRRGELRRRGHCRARAPIGAR